MFGKIRRFYYDNKEYIWKRIIVVIVILGIIYFINFQMSQQRKKVENNVPIINNNYTTSTTKEVTTNSTIINDKSAVDGTTFSKSQKDEEVGIIQNFIEYCNNKNIEKAYELLSDDCKSEMYPTANDFYSKYINSNFSQKRTATVENWTGSVYKITMKNDFMATGELNGTTTQDYITVVYKNGENKLNVNNFIDKAEINKETVYQNLKISVLYKKQYFDYEEYEVKIENKTESQVILDTLNSTKTIYIQDENGINYYSRSHELFSGLLKINSGAMSKINIKFSKTYSTDRQTKALVFSDVIFNNNTSSTNKESQIISVNL